MYETILARFGELVAAGGGAAVVAYAIYSSLGKNWLENRFAAQLEDHKHKNQQALEQFKHAISAEADRASRVYELELEVLPEAWSRLHRANEALGIFVSPLKLEADVASMSQEKFAEFLETSGFNASSEVVSKQGKERTKIYQRMRFHHEYVEAATAFKEFHSYIEERSVFLSADVRDKFRSVDNEIWSAIVDKQTGSQYDDIELERSSLATVRDKINPLQRELEELIQRRIRLIRELEQ